MQAARVRCNIFRAVSLPLRTARAAGCVQPRVFPRTFHNSVVLPNGQIVIVGGMNVALTISDVTAIMMPELWDPQSETFTRLAPLQTPRTYHSEALLLPDGRVFVGGGGLCYMGTTPCSNHPDAEILTTPHLLNADGAAAGRPAIASAPAAAGLGSTIMVTTDSDIVQFDLVRMAATTHSVNNDQRRIPMSIASGDSTSGYVLPISADSGIVLPGNSRAGCRPHSRAGFSCSSISSRFRISGIGAAAAIDQGASVREDAGARAEHVMAGQRHHAEAHHVR
jgi:galactose oxidase-like protein/Kelch motif protein